MEPITFFLKHAVEVCIIILRRKKGRALQTHTPTPQKTMLLTIQLTCDKRWNNATKANTHYTSTKETWQFWCFISFSFHSYMMVSNIFPLHTRPPQWLQTSNASSSCRVQPIVVILLLYPLDHETCIVNHNSAHWSMTNTNVSTYNYLSPLSFSEQNSPSPVTNLKWQMHIPQSMQIWEIFLTCSWMLQTAQSKNLSSPTVLYILRAVCKRYQARRASIEIRYQKECKLSSNESTIIPAVVSRMSTL